MFTKINTNNKNHLNHKIKNGLTILLMLKYLEGSRDDAVYLAPWCSRNNPPARYCWFPATHSALPLNTEGTTHLQRTVGSLRLGAPLPFKQAKPRLQGCMPLVTWNALAFNNKNQGREGLNWKIWKTPLLYLLRDFIDFIY